MSEAPLAIQSHRVDRYESYRKEYCLKRERKEHLFIVVLYNYNRFPGIIMSNQRLSSSDGSEQLAKKTDVNEAILSELSMGFSNPLSMRNETKINDATGVFDVIERSVYEQVSPGSAFILQDRGELVKKVAARKR